MAKMRISHTDQSTPLSPKTVFIGIHRIPDGENFDTREYHGADEESVLRDMMEAFVAKTIDSMPAATVLQEHLDLRAVLENLRFSPDRAEEVASQIQNTSPDTLGRFSSYFTPSEAIRAYLRLNSDEDIEIIEYQPVSISKYGSRKPAAINVIYYDIKARMAIAREGEALIGYMALENVEKPHHDDYEWHAGFDFDFLTPDQASVLREAGHSDIVEAFEKRGAVFEG